MMYVVQTNHIYYDFQRLYLGFIQYLRAYEIQEVYFGCIVYIQGNCTVVVHHDKDKLDECMYLHATHYSRYQQVSPICVQVDRV